jgi:hypothetical protein
MHAPNVTHPSGRALLLLAAVLLLCAAASTVGLWFDDRRLPAALGGAPVWTKPLKFHLSMALQLLTVFWALHAMAQRGVRVPGQRVLVGLLIVTVVFEASYISLQGARGVASHFNRFTPWESVAATLMAMGANVLVGTSGWIGLVALRRWWAQWPGQRQTLLLGIGLGFAGMFVLAGWTGAALGQFRGPFVVAPDTTGWSMPMTGWRMDVGDLRMAHFMGVHTMQALPLVAWWLDRSRSRTGEAGVAIFAVIWVFATLFLLQWAKANNGVV